MENELKLDMIETAFELQQKIVKTNILKFFKFLDWKTKVKEKGGLTFSCKNPRKIKKEVFETALFDVTIKDCEIKVNEKILVKIETNLDASTNYFKDDAETIFNMISELYNYDFTDILDSIYLSA